jgi:hypothetical protein
MTQLTSDKSLLARAALAKSYNETGILEGIHYYLEGERVVFTDIFHFQRGSCCDNGCRHCPYTKPRKKGNINLEESKQ